MKKFLISMLVLVALGCVETRNEKIPMSRRECSSSVVSTETCWWRMPYYENRKNHPMDEFLNRSDSSQLSPISSSAILRWPKKMPEAPKSSTIAPVESPSSPLLDKKLNDFKSDKVY